MKDFLQSKNSVLVILVLYLIFSSLYWHFFSNEIPFLTFLRESIDILGMLIALLSLAWVYTAKEAVFKLGRKYRYLEVIELIDSVCNSAGHIEDNECKKLIARILVIDPKNLEVKSEVLDDDDSGRSLVNRTLLPKKLSLESIQEQLINEYVALSDSNRNPKISDCNTLVFNFLAFQAFIKDRVIGDMEGR